MNNEIANNAFRFIALVLVQVLVLNNINFLGYINPYCYVLFIILYPVNSNRMLFLFLSFLMGLTIDMFMDSGGVHAAASVTIAYLRPVFLKSTFGLLFEHHAVKFKETDIETRITYMIPMVVIHHFVLFGLEVFNIGEILLILKKTLFSSIFTLILCLLIIVLFSRKSK